MVGKPVPQKTPRPEAGRPPLGSGSESPRTEPVTPSAAQEAVRILQATAAGDAANRKRSSRTAAKGPARLVSLDAFRGFIMMMLAANGFGIYAFSRIAQDAPVWQTHDYGFWQRIGFHFEHPEWISAFEYFKVSFWDLIQPSFMFMVGVSMPFSYVRREKLGAGIVGRASHALIRSVVLVLLGVFLYSLGHQRTNWIFPNVLCQIGLGYFFAWLLLGRGRAVQLAALAVILIGYWGWFRMNPPPENYDFAAVGASLEEGEILEGSFAAWSKNGNAAFLFDQWLLPRLRSGRAAEPAAETAAEESTRLSQWLVASLQEADAGGTVTPAATDTSADSVENATKSASDAASEVSTDQGGDTNAVPESDTAAAAAGTAEPEVKDAGPGWFRQWFLSNPEAYTFNSGGYTTLNFIPSIATTLLGILCGQLLISPDYSKWGRLGMLLAAAVLCLGLGILADQTVCPVIKRIWTPSWVLFSGGYVIGLLALFYLLFDIAPLKILAFPLVVVGMNSILIYILGETLGDWTRENVVRVHFSGMIGQVFGPKALDAQWYESITLSTGVFVLFWLLLLWLYRQRIFLRI